MDMLNDDEKSIFGSLLFADAKPTIHQRLSLPEEAVLNRRERAMLRQIEQTPVDETPARSPSMIIVMKATRLCNLRCTYCHAWREGPGHVMSFAVLARTIRDALQAPGARHIEFVWHGGEATLLGVKFYRKALWLQQRYAPKGTSFSNAIQTNAVDISDDMLEFLRDYSISIGVSIDGPPAINDTRRVDVNGAGTSRRILATLRRLRQKGVKHGLLAVIDSEIAAMPARELLDYFVLTGARSLDILNALPENDESCNVIGTYIPWPEYVKFMCHLYEVWRDEYQDRLEIRTFISLLNKVANREHGLCIFAGDCQGKYLTIESNGNIAACDKYVGDDNYLYGNIFKGSLNRSLAGSQNLKRAKAELDCYKTGSSQCQWYSVCTGGCPHDRKTSRRLLNDTSGCCGLGPLLSLMEKDTARGTICLP
ncbi:radical SAM protein [Rhizobium sullae]|nr:radical SAM protein [Rhizobium sullae]UWU14379.1 radical SAM protein [Rhizobium sullae]